jgi:protein-disulfide isomerase
MGPAHAPVTIVEFADFECPACRLVTRTALRAIRAEYPTKVAILFRHWPLSYHPHAYPAARAAECAAAQDRFAEFHDLLYKLQDSLGHKSMSGFAKDAEVPDIAAFDRCDALTDTIPIIEADIPEVTALGGTGTPTIIVNGLQLMTVPDSGSLEQLVRAAIKKAKG